MRNLVPISVAFALILLVGCQEFENAFGGGSKRDEVPGPDHGIVVSATLTTTDQSGSGFEQSLTDATKDIAAASKRFDIVENGEADYAIELALTAFSFRTGKIEKELFDKVSRDPSTEELEELDAALASTATPLGEDKRVAVVVGTATVRAAVRHRESGTDVAAGETVSTVVDRAPEPPTPATAAEAETNAAEQPATAEPTPADGPSPTFRRAVLDVAVASALRDVLPAFDADIVERAGDYMPDTLYVVLNPDQEGQYRIASLQSGPDENGTGSFLDSVTGKTFGSQTFTHTRQATAADVTTGARLYVFWAGASNTEKPHSARRLRSSGSHYWVLTEVIGTDELDRSGVFSAPIAGSQRKVHVTNARVAID